MCSLTFPPEHKSTVTPVVRRGIGVQNFICIRLFSVELRIFVCFSVRGSTNMSNKVELIGNIPLIIRSHPIA